jgi:hypothetical protein
MRKTFSILAIAVIMLGMGALSGSQANPGNPVVLEIEPGLTEFETLGQSFLVICTQPLQISFQCVSEERVYGVITAMDGESLSEVKLVWVNYLDFPLTLAEGVAPGRSVFFDSDDVTGHNEKFR